MTLCHDKSGVLKASSSSAKIRRGEKTLQSSSEGEHSACKAAGGRHKVVTFPTGVIPEKRQVYFQKCKLIQLIRFIVES